MPERRHRRFRTYAIAVATVAAATARGKVAAPYASHADQAMVYLLAVLVAALGGRGPGLTAAVLSAAAFDFFFVEPIHAFAVADRTFLITFAVMLAVGIAIGSLVQRVRDAEAESRDRALEARAEELRSTLLSSVSHDLRTPLAVITGMATSLRDEASGTQRESLDTVVGEAQRLSRILTNLLSITKVETGAEPRREWVPLEELVGSALGRLEPELADHPVTVVAADDLAHVDPILFEQLLINLVENAAKHTPSACPIEVRASRRDGRDRRGPRSRSGSPAGPTAAGVREVLPRLRQARRRRRPRARGVSRGRARAWRHDRGSAACGRRRELSRAPARSRNATRARGRDRRAGEGVVTAAADTVLVVEDEAAMRRFLSAALHGHGFRVIEAGTLAAAERLATESVPSAILLDLGLPDGDGLTFVRTLRTWSAAPVIVLSARDREDDKVTALDAGADDYLTKPFGTSELLARIRVALRHARAQRTPDDPVLAVGTIRIDQARHEVSVAGRTVHLTPIEYKLLSLLARHAGKVLTHRQLLQEVWGPRSTHQTHYLRVHMAALRRKVEEDPARPRWLTTEPGVGYRLLDEPTRT